MGTCRFGAAFALKSQKKASAAIEKKVFEKEIIPVHAIRYVGNEKKTFEFNPASLPLYRTVDGDDPKGDGLTPSAPPPTPSAPIVPPKK